jgi:hypothetical protein
VLYHISASFLALSAFFRAAFHVLVARDFFTFFSTARTRLRARIANQGRHGATPRDNLGRACADICTILTHSQRGQVLFLAFGNQVAAVGRARIALALTICARFCARLHCVTVSLVFRRSFALLPRPGREPNEKETNQADAA